MEFIYGLNKEQTIELLQKYIDTNSYNYICCFIDNNLKRGEVEYNDITFFVEYWYGYFKNCDASYYNKYSTGIFGRAILSNQIKRVNFIKTIINNLNELL